MEVKDVAAILAIARSKDRGGADARACWEWFKPSSEPRKHYAYVQLSSGKQIRMHRVVAWAFAGAPGELENYPDVHHTCANRNCVNPDHLRPLEGEQNRLEGRIREWFEERIATLNAAILAGAVPISQKEKRERDQVDRIRQRRDAGDSLAASLAAEGLSDDTYRRRLNRYYPELVKSPGGRVAVAIANRDDKEIDAVVLEKSVLNREHPDCRRWTGSHRSGYANWGSAPLNVYMHRATVWVAFGCPTRFELMPTLRRDTVRCSFGDCVTPDHWKPVTDFSDIVRNDVLLKLVREIRELAEALAKRNPHHPLLDDGWDIYLPMHIREILGTALTTTL